MDNDEHASIGCARGVAKKSKNNDARLRFVPGRGRFSWEEKLVAPLIART
jgi:hypothetical protein